ncbi:MAG: FAD-dependent thymidylate synthase [Ruminococcus sp.]|jgi:thymidylate synthase (FAD)|nr:FAD-dependent thymidylate synthase [Ruminococcus sp.]
MLIIPPSTEILDDINPARIMQNIEKIGRICYKSEDRITDDSAEKFIRNIIKSGHESVIEHEKISVRFICDRGVTHEIVRHRIASYSQESTRYCNYTKDKFGSELTFIRPCFWEEDSAAYEIWKQTMQASEDAYNALIEGGATPEQARSVLPTSLKTEIAVTMDLREWRHFFRLRGSARSHPQMREVVVPLLVEFKKLLPLIFEDINVE